MRRVCDLALRSAADLGVKVTDETNARFKEATEILSNYSVRRHLLWATMPAVLKMSTHPVLAEIRYSPSPCEWK
jgi:hypothetical protein